MYRTFIDLEQQEVSGDIIVIRSIRWSDKKGCRVNRSSFVFQMTMSSHISEEEDSSALDRRAVIIHVLWLKIDLFIFLVTLARPQLHALGIVESRWRETYRHAVEQLKPRVNVKILKFVLVSQKFFTFSSNQFQNKKIRSSNNKRRDSYSTHQINK
jgi:hypothetical protein